MNQYEDRINFSNPSDLSSYSLPAKDVVWHGELGGYTYAHVQLDYD